MQINYFEKDGFIRGKALKKPSIKNVAKLVAKKGFDIENFEFWYHDSEGLYRFYADLTPSKQITKELETEILSKLDILFNRKNYSKEEQTEIKRLIWK